jgi:hypothetical protein
MVEMYSDWFSRLFGFPESDYQSKLALEKNEMGQQVLRTLESPRRSFVAGNFHTPSLVELRRECEVKAAHLKQQDHALTVGFVYGDVSKLHADPQFKLATFQAASQFNCLEFVGPHMTPEHGITVYEGDRTQGPACSIACGAGTAYRNYFHRWTTRDGAEMVRTDLSAAVTGG